MRRAISITIIFFIFHAFVHAQGKCLSVNELDSVKISLSNLDSNYFKIDNHKGFRAAFGKKTSSNDFYWAWQKFDNELDKFLKDNAFVWKEDTIILTQQFYFNTDGTIDYVIIKLKKPVSPAEEETYKNLLTVFIQTHKIGIQSKAKYRQAVLKIIE